ncbi:oxygen-independent coproporphyrinogen-3 oxidase [Litoreibacter ponti]|uniref:Heme chaperone HemW n=1 Tax=Litoreibacter ponti TaxID=1510457 RepID=A0A2T6BP86_9RHOB|nr:radical SAM family heme chaperone HemW [Litoreibacter ponti]PTX57889.1 oxygen-independent coproporphyrinogen-3 oxidase [Litoreibacter ponti]
MSVKNWQRGGFGIYIHWPFCQAKCPYCDFNSHVTANIDQSRWKRAYLLELDRMSELTKDCVVSSVFFGGGTPSLMDPDLVASMIERIKRNWRCRNELEITLEANPTSVEAGRFIGYRDGGVNRVSMGIQALNNRDLKALGRLHSVDEAKSAFEIARSTFPRVSFDLIYARQDQTLADWHSELSDAMEMAVDHLSLYQLTIEDGTAFGDRFSRGKLGGLPSDDTSADMYELTQELTETAGFSGYEVSNHAREGQESQHNLIYWRGGDYAGIGPGAHGRIEIEGKRCATETPLAPGKWLEQVENTGSGDGKVEVLSNEEQALEYLLMSLRLKEGCDLVHLRALDRYLVSDNKISNLIDQNRLIRTKDTLVVPPKSRILLNAILAELAR